MKKTLRMTLALTMLIAVLVGCGTDPTQPTVTAPTGTTAPTEPSVPVATQPPLSAEEQAAKDQADLLAAQAQEVYDSYKDCPVFWCGVNSADELAEGQKAIWVQELPEKAPSSQKNTNKGKIKAVYIYYPCEQDPSQFTDYQLKNREIIRFFAYLGIPDTEDEKVPGMIYIHGATNHASASAVVEAMNRGFACLAFDTEGTTNTTGPNNFSDAGSAFAKDLAGHISNDCFESWEKPLEEQWLYWVVGDTILANTVMRSLEQLDQVGLYGVSWGGIISSSVIGFDYRYDFCVPIYCSLGLEFNVGYDVQKLKERPIARYLWHNRERLAKSPVPTMILCGDDDLYCSVNCNVLTYESLQKGKLIIKPHFDHSHQHGVSAPETYRYVDWLLGRTEGFIEPDHQPTAEDDYSYTLTLDVPSDITEPKVQLHYMTYAIRKYQNDKSLPNWKRVDLPYDPDTKTVTVTVPEKAYMYFITFEGHNEAAAQARKLSPYQEYCDYAPDAIYSSTNIVLLLGDTIQYLYKK